MVVENLVSPVALEGGECWVLVGAGAEARRWRWAGGGEVVSGLRVEGVGTPWGREDRERDDKGGAR